VGWFLIGGSHVGIGSLGPIWTEHLGVVWVDEEDDLSKLFGTPFGLSLKASNVDEFLKDRVNKSLRYWCTTKVNSTGRSIIANKVLLSSMFFFMSILGDTKQGINRVKASIANYMWSGSMNHARAKVAWVQYYQPKEDGGLGLVNPANVLVALMTK
jgi:hypothetical protein